MWFHLQIAKMAKNRVLEDLFKVNLEHIYLRFVLNKVDPHRMAAAVQEHHNLLQRMKSRDVLGSIEIIRLHVRNARNVIIAAISQENEPIYL